MNGETWTLCTPHYRAGPQRKVPEYKGTKGEQVFSLKDLHDLAIGRRSVFVPGSHCWRNPWPAAFIISQQGMTILHMLNQGMYVYEKETK